MVTRFQIDKLGSRIDTLALALTPPELQPKYKVYLTFFEPSGNLPAETWDDFYARYPDAPRPFEPDIVLSFD